MLMGMGKKKEDLFFWNLVLIPGLCVHGSTRMYLFTLSTLRATTWDVDRSIIEAVVWVCAVKVIAAATLEATPLYLYPLILRASVDEAQRVRC